MRFILKILLILSPFLAMAQSKTYLGLEVGPKFEVYQSIDNGDGLYTKPFFFSPIYGITIGQEINKVFTFETGLYLNNYGESYRISGDFGGYNTSNALLAYQIPLRLKARLNVIKERLSILTTIGYTFAINSDFGSKGTSKSWYAFTNNPTSQFNDSTRTESVSNYNLKQTYGLIETGIGIEYHLKNALSLYLAANYMTGFQKIVEMDVRYWINDRPVQTGTVFSNGDYYSVVLGIKYPISHFWTAKANP